MNRKMKNGQIIAVIMSILTILGFIGVQIFDITIFKGCHPKTDTLKEPEPQINVEKEPELQVPLQIDAEKEPEPQAPPQPIGVEKLPLSKLIEILKDLSSLSYRLEFIKDNINFMPDVLSLKELNDILDLFSRRSYKLTVTKIFLSRLENNYPNREFERFKGQYNRSDYKVEAINLLLRNKR